MAASVVCVLPLSWETVVELLESSADVCVNKCSNDLLFRPLPRFENLIGLERRPICFHGKRHGCVSTPHLQLHSRVRILVVSHIIVISSLFVSWSYASTLWKGPSGINSKPFLFVNEPPLNGNGLFYRSLTMLPIGCSEPMWSSGWSSQLRR